MPLTRLFGSKRRETLWLREKHAAYVAGRGRLPICNLCGLPVAQTDAWDESHHREKPRAFGGGRGLEHVGIAHHRCNHEHGAKVVTPAKAKADRVRRFHIGAGGPGLGKARMRGGRRSGERKTFGHGVVRRQSAAERHAAMRERLALTAADGSPVGLWAPDPPAAEA